MGVVGLTAVAFDSSQQGMAHMAGHMYMTVLRPVKPGDQQKADAIVAAAKIAMAPYQDYHKALADGYEIFLPNVPQPQYHFTKYEYALEARSQFDPARPTSLLYKKTTEGGYTLVGVMYTDRVDATEDELEAECRRRGLDSFAPLIGTALPRKPGAPSAKGVEYRP